MWNTLLSVLRGKSVVVDMSHVHTTRCMKYGCGTGTRNMFVQEVGGGASWMGCTTQHAILLVR